MKRIIGLLVLVMIFMVNPAIAADNDPAGIDPAKGEFVNGKYTNKSPAFTMQFPDGWETDKKEGNEVFRIVGLHPYKIPVVALDMLDKGANAPELGSDAAVAAYLAHMKKNQPKSTNHKVEKKGIVELQGGIKAMNLIIRWNLNPMVEVFSSVLQVYKGDKIITLNATTVEAEGTTADELTAILKTLEFK
jgi:hypothetical protein